MSDPGGTPAQAPVSRYRVRFAKDGPLRWVGHLDLQRVWLHTLRRAEVPLAYSAGFHPHPRLLFAASLPLGFIGRAELLELGLTERLEAGALHQRLRHCAAPGLGIEDVASVEAETPALGRGLSGFDYLVTLDPSSATTLPARIAALLATTTLPRERRRRAYDLRPLIQRLELTAEGGLSMRLSGGVGPTGRPDEVLRALGYEPADATIERRGLCFDAAAATPPSGVAAAAAPVSTPSAAPGPSPSTS
ncbi:MAG: DUF2344 domain-containing protein [Proteobacteria bacterium]|nr:DUF2344 domain-containing protein [Pseudomonadota bacterium]